MRWPLWCRGRGGVLLGTSLAVVAEMVPGAPAPLLTLAGLWLLFVAPTAVWRGTAARVVSTRDGSLMLAVGFAVITDILVALTVNTVLPPLGVPHPLSRVALASASAVAVIAVGAFVPEEQRPAAAARRGPPRGAVPVAVLGAITLALSVAGPIRLNNGFSGAVSTVALVLVAALLLLLLARRGRYPVAVVSSGLYVASASLLLLVSLRGWSITGHDIQREYEYFQLTLGGGRWNIAAYANPYNACLSVTLLPVSVVRLTAVPGVYVFKVVLPLLFAFTPLLVHRAVRNVAPQFVALLSAVFFMAFPTFFTDMAYLGRQEVAFLLLGCAMVALTDSAGPLRTRRIAFMALLGGIVLSHYSTTYVLVGVLATAFVCDLLWRAGTHRRRNRMRRRDHLSRSGSFVTWWIVLIPAVLALVWAVPVTHTSGQLQTTLGNAYHAALDLGHGSTGSSGGTPAQQLDEYRARTLADTAAKRATGGYLPLKTVNAYPVAPVAAQNMEPTAAGRLVQRLGLSTVTLNGLLRALASLLFLGLVPLGLAVTVAGRHRSFRPARDQVTLTIGALAMVAELQVLPQLSVDYSVQRAYQQGLFFFAPFVAAGALWLLRWAGRRRVPLTCALAAALFLDLTGVVPKVLGGYPAQLQLSNAGQYYDVYYPTPAERKAAYWLNQQVASQGRGKAEPVVQTDSFTFNREQTLLTGPVVGDIFPTVLGSGAYVLLGSTTVRDGSVTVFYQGGLLTYRYPVDLLDRTKNEVYSSEGAEVFR